MTFQIKHVHEKNSQVLVSGYFSPTNAGEAELMSVIVEESYNCPHFCYKFVTNGKTMLFKGVEINLFKQMVSYIGRTMNIDIELKATKYFTGNRELIKGLIDN